MLKKIILLMMFSTSALAQGYRNELSAFGSYNRIKHQGQTSSFSILDLGYGYYFTPQWVGKLDLTRVSADSFGYTDIGVGAKYYTSVGRRGSFSWFFDGTLGIEKAPSHHNRRYQLGLGGAWFVTEATSFDAGIHWYRIATDPFSTSGTIFGIGFTTRF